MTGVTLTIDMGESAALARIDDLIARMATPLGFYRDVGQYLADSTRERFARERSPEGIPWAKLKPATIRNRIRAKRSPLGILRMHGDLVGSINARPSADQVSIGTPVEYAAIHQLGGEIGREARTRTIYQHYDARTDAFDPIFRKRSKSNFARDVAVPAHTIAIPARPYLGISASDRMEIAEIARIWLTGA